MGDPRNPARAGEHWDMNRILSLFIECIELPKYAVISGGWAWHFMSPPHEELKLLHDHKDVDVFVPPDRFPEICAHFQGRGYKRCWTRFDGKTEGFYRFEGRPKGVKVLVDVFLRDVPAVRVVPAGVPSSVAIVAPATLITFYREKIHSTDDCVAVRAARELLRKGIDPMFRPELVGE